MTLKNEIPVSIEHKIHRVYHQHHHHHHYHLHHLLDHHHLHIHNQSVFRSHVSSSQSGDVAIDDNVSQASSNDASSQPIEQYTSRRDPTTTQSTSKSRRIRFLLVSAFAYILSPIDFIPEAIFGVFGILDDLIFLLMCLFCIAIILLYPLVRELTHKKCAILKAACSPSTVCQLRGTKALGGRKG
jgi:uncharacterized membrane protein YkvA (DUF1232 family)